jgi:putative ABC transport system substrate-binding protein
VELTAKRLGLLRELAPQATRFVALVSPNAVNADVIVENVHASVRTLGFPVEILYAGHSDRDIEAAFANLSQKPGTALLVAVDPFFFNRRALIVALATRHALPTVYFAREFADIGGLVSYGTNLDNTHELIGIYTAASSKARNRPTYRSRSRQNSKWSLISRPPRRSPSTCRPRCSRLPTR